jgi:hypothetical protein
LFVIRYRCLFVRHPIPVPFCLSSDTGAFLFVILSAAKNPENPHEQQPSGHFNPQPSRPCLWNHSGPIANFIKVWRRNFQGPKARSRLAWGAAPGLRKRL